MAAKRDRRTVARYSPSAPKITKRAAKTRNRNQTQPTPTDGPTGVAPIQGNLDSTQPTTAGDYASNASQSHSVEALVSNPGLTTGEQGTPATTISPTQSLALHEPHQASQVDEQRTVTGPADLQNILIPETIGTVPSQPNCVTRKKPGKDQGSIMADKELQIKAQLQQLNALRKEYNRNEERMKGLESTNKALMLKLAACECGRKENVPQNDCPHSTNRNQPSYSNVPRTDNITPMLLGHISSQSATISQLISHVSQQTQQTLQGQATGHSGILLHLATQVDSLVKMLIPPPPPPPPLPVFLNTHPRVFHQHAYIPSQQSQPCQQTQPTHIPCQQPQPTYIPLQLPQPTYLPQQQSQPTNMPCQQPQPTYIPRLPLQSTCIPQQQPQPTCLPCQQPQPTYITRQQPGQTSGHRTNMNFAHANCDTSGEQHRGDSPHRTQRAIHNRVNIHAPRISTDDNGVVRNTPPVSGVWPHKERDMTQIAPNAATRDANDDVMINAKRGRNDDSVLHKAPAHEPHRDKTATRCESPISVNSDYDGLSETETDIFDLLQPCQGFHVTLPSEPPDMTS